MKKTWEWLAQIGICCLFIITACDKKNSEITSSAVSEPDSTLVAKIDDVVLGEQDFENYLKAINRSQAKAEFRQRLKDEWITKELFAKAAVLSGFDKDPLYEAKMAQYRRELLSKKYVDSQLLQRFPDELLKPQYEARKAEFSSEEIHIAHILIAVDAVADTETWDQAEQAAKKIKGRLHSGESFEELALNLSNDPSTAVRGGDFGWMPLEIATERFGDVFKSVGPSELIGPVRTEQGWHLIAVLDPVQQKVQPFAEVKRQLIEQKRILVVKLLNDELRKKLKVEVE